MNGDADVLERYLSELRAELKARGVADAGDLPEEIRSHVREVTGGRGGQEAVAMALEAFGTPARLAATVASERAAGAIGSGPKRAPLGHRLFGWLLDSLWVAGAPVVLGLASVQGWLWFAELLWGQPGGQGETVLLLLGTTHSVLTVIPTLGAIVWLILAARGTARAIRAGRPTLGMRAAGLTFVDEPGGQIVVRASSALAFGLAPAARRGRAIAGIVLVGLLGVFAIAWGPVMSALGDRSMYEVERAQDYCREVVAMAYGAAFSRDPGAVSGLQEIFASSSMSYRDFAGGLEADGVRTNTEGACGYRSDGASATIEVVSQEWAESKSVTPTYRLVFFTFERRDAAPTPGWFLVKVVRDPLGRAGGNGPSGEEARGLVERLLGEAGTPAADRATDGTEIMTDSFAASDSARPLLRADRTTPPFDRPPSIDSIEFVDRFAVVTTTEWWLPDGTWPGAGTAPAKRFVYRVLIARGTPLADGRDAVE